MEPKGTPSETCPLDFPAIQVLGALAPCDESGPHRRDVLRRRSRLLQPDFDMAIRQLAGRGWLDVEGNALWVTPPGEEAVLRLFA